MMDKGTFVLLKVESFLTHFIELALWLGECVNVLRIIWVISQVILTGGWLNNTLFCEGVWVCCLLVFFQVNDKLWELCWNRIEIFLVLVLEIISITA